MDDVTARILKQADRLSRGKAGDVPAAFSPLRGRTLTSTPAASTDKSFSDLLEEAAYGLSSQVRTGVTRLRGGDVAAVEEEMRADPSAGSYAATYRDLGVPRPAANVLGFATEVLEPGPGELGAFGRALGTLAMALPPSVMRALGKASGLVDDAGAALMLGHGTRRTYDVPRGSLYGAKGPGFYTGVVNRSDPDRGIYNSYAEPNKYGWGPVGEPQVRLGYATGPIFRATEGAQWPEGMKEEILSRFPLGTKNREVIEWMEQMNEMTPSGFVKYMEDTVGRMDEPSFRDVLKELGFVGMEYDFLSAYDPAVLVFEPDESFVAAFDFEAIRRAIGRAYSAGRMSGEELDQALAALERMGGNQ